MRASLVLVSGVLAAGALVGTASVASAAPAAAAPTSAAPSVKNTTQKLSYDAKHKGGYKHTVSIVFGAHTFTVPKYKEHGRFTDRNGTLTMALPVDKKDVCRFSGSYQASAHAYVGTYVCPDAKSGAFQVTAP